MVRFRGTKDAFGAPGIEPKWSRGDKDGVGTAYSADSKIWFSTWRGTLTEAYFPTVDTPQLRDMEFLISDGQTFFHEEKRHLVTTSERLSHHALGYRIRNSDPEDRYTIEKEIITDPHLACILQNTKLEVKRELFPRFGLYLLAAPHLDSGGRGNSAYVVEAAGREIFMAEKNGTWLALGANVPFKRLSCGYVGYSDGWTDLSSDLRMDWEFDRALGGNVALTAQIGAPPPEEFTLGLAFGTSQHNAVSTLFQSLGDPFETSKSRFLEQWERPYAKLLPLGKASNDGSNLYHSSYSLLLSHEDKTFPGAFIASLSIPWGETKGDEDRGGYHLVWTRDLVHIATALLAAGDTETPFRAMIYLASSQQDDGGFAQNFWIDGERYWGGTQLDEVALPIILAWRLQKAGALRSFDPYPMILKAAAYLIRNGPATQQERWEEAEGYSPSTLAANIAALVCAADFARDRRDETSARYLEEYADFIESHIEKWTVTTEGEVVPSVERHYVRILPLDVNDPHPLENPNAGVISIANAPPQTPNTFSAKDIVDAGFLELVRYGIRRPDDPTVVDSLKVVDTVLKVSTPYGPCWHRYTHDGYGQREDGGPYQGWGKGRAWPLLTGERGHYEVAAGKDPGPFISAMERFASSSGLLPEQIWDEPDMAENHLFFGKPTGSAMPLAWAHAEYIKLLRSAHDGKVFDLIPIVASRYLTDRSQCLDLEIWKFNRQPRTVRRGSVLRVQTSEPFILHWSEDGWGRVNDIASSTTALGIDFVDIDTNRVGEEIRFTFYWKARERWEGTDYLTAVDRQPSGRATLPS